MKQCLTFLRKTELYMLNLIINNKLLVEKHLILSQQKSNANVTHF